MNEEPMRVNILGIAGSPRRGGTEIIVNEALKAARTVEGVVTDFWSTATKKLIPCDACYRCYREGTVANPCVSQDDDMKELYPKIMWADAFIIGTPVYFHNVTAQLKIVLDRLCPFYNDSNADFPNVNKVKGVLKDKICLGIAVASWRGGGQSDAISAIFRGMLFDNEMLVLGGNTSNISVPIGTPTAVTGGLYPDRINPAFRRMSAVKKDLVGLETIRYAGKRVAEVTKIWKTGLKASGLR